MGKSLWRSAVNHRAAPSLSTGGGVDDRPVHIAWTGRGRGGDALGTTAHTLWMPCGQPICVHRPPVVGWSPVHGRYTRSSRRWPAETSLLHRFHRPYEDDEIHPSTNPAPRTWGATDPWWNYRKYLDGRGRRTGRITRSRLPRTGFAGTPSSTRVSAPTTMCSSTDSGVVTRVSAVLKGGVPR